MAGVDTARLQRAWRRGIDHWFIPPALRPLGLLVAAIFSALRKGRCGIPGISIFVGAPFLSHARFAFYFDSYPSFFSVTGLHALRARWRSQREIEIYVPRYEKVYRKALQADDVKMIYR